MTNTLQELLAQLSSFAPRFFGAIALLIVGYIVAKFVAGIIRKVLERIKIDQFGEKLMNVDMIRNSNFSIKLSSIIAKFIFYFLMLFFMVAASDLLHMPAISELVTDLFRLLPKLLVGFIILIFGILVSDMIKSLVETTLVSLGIPSAKVISMFLFYFLFINVAILAIAQADINTAFLEQNISIIIAGGVLAFAIGYGLASKDVVSNFLSSLYSSDKFSVGDTIEVGGDVGQVIQVDKTSVTLAVNGKRVIYPLKVMLNERVAVHNAHKRLDS